MDFINRSKVMTPLTHPDPRDHKARMSDKNWFIFEDKIMKRKSVSK